VESCLGGAPSNNALKPTKRGNVFASALRPPSSLSRASQLSAVLHGRLQGGA
jgi:hypothetical protein